MDISSGIVSWPHACPGSLMKKLQLERNNDVQKIRSLAMSYVKDEYWVYGVVGCGDLDIVHRFIETINSLEVLRIGTLEKDITGLWPVIFHHANSLRSLTFYTAPHFNFDIITPAMVRQIASEIPHLNHLGLSISVKEAEAALKEAAEHRALGQRHEETVIDELVRVGGLQKVELFIRLEIEASSFSGKHIVSASGTRSFPELETRPCFQLAQGIFDRFLKHNEESPLERVEVHFFRHYYQDRAQYDFEKASVRVTKEGTVFRTKEDSWQWAPTRTSGELRNEIKEANL